MAVKVVQPTTEAFEPMAINVDELPTGEGGAQCEGPSKN